MELSDVTVDIFNQEVMSFMTILDQYSSEAELTNVNFSSYKSMMSYGLYFDKTRVLITFDGLLKKYYSDIETKNEQLFLSIDFNELGSGFEAMMIIPMWRDLCTLWPVIDKNKKETVWMYLDSIGKMSKSLQSI
jgi:hypothetical protein